MARGGHDEKNDEYCASRHDRRPPTLAGVIAVFGTPLRQQVTGPGLVDDGTETSNLFPVQAKRDRGDGVIVDSMRFTSSLRCG